MLLKRISLIFAFVGISLTCSFAHAQSIPGIQNPLVVTLIPNEPRPNEVAIIGLQSYSMDLDRALITWYVDGVNTASGVGMKSFRLMAGEAGSVKVVDVTVSSVGLGTVSDSITIRPAYVGLLWESDTYTPPFYQGKALHSYNGSFKVIAIPELYTLQGAKINPKDLVYTWSKNGEVEGLASGYGRNTYTGSQTSYLREGEEISVIVSSPQENVVASNRILMTPTVPEVIFYEKSPLYGIIYEKAFRNTFNLRNEELTALAEPYFFSVKERNPANLTYSWSLNGTTLTDFANKSSITLRKTSDDSGKANLGVILQNTSKLLQGAKTGVNISYE